jgi:hypothetical protein
VGPRRTPSRPDATAIRPTGRLCRRVVCGRRGDSGRRGVSSARFASRADGSHSGRRVSSRPTRRVPADGSQPPGGRVPGRRVAPRPTGLLPANGSHPRLTGPHPGQRVAPAAGFSPPPPLPVPTWGSAPDPAPQTPEGLNFAPATLEGLIFAPSKPEADLCSVEPEADLCPGNTRG